MAGTQNTSCKTPASETVGGGSSSSKAGTLPRGNVEAPRASNQNVEVRKIAAPGTVETTRTSPSVEVEVLGEKRCVPHASTSESRDLTGVFTSNFDVSPALDENKVRDYLLKEISLETRELEAQSLRVNEEIAESLRLFRHLKRSVVSQYYASSRSNVRKHPAIVKAEEEEEAVGLSGGEGTSEGGTARQEAFGSTPHFSEGLLTRKSARKKTVPQSTASGGDPIRPLATFSVRFYVGTMCKYLGNSDTGLSTHKWTVYIRNCDTNRENICHHIAKVTFILHDSYKPNHVVKVRKEPFKITREGWGEFGMKITIGFTEREYNRNVELIHPVSFLHVKSAVPVISLETPVEMELTTSQVHTVIKEDEKDKEAAVGSQERGDEVESGERKGEVDKDMMKVDGVGKSVEMKKEVPEPDLRQTVLEYLTDEDMIMGLDERLNKSLDQDIDIT